MIVCGDGPQAGIIADAHHFSKLISLCDCNFFRRFFFNYSNLVWITTQFTIIPTLCFRIIYLSTLIFIFSHHRITLYWYSKMRYSIAIFVVFSVGHLLVWPVMRWISLVCSLFVCVCEFRTEVDGYISSFIYNLYISFRVWHYTADIHIFNLNNWCSAKDYIIYVFYEQPSAWCSLNRHWMLCRVRRMRVHRCKWIFPSINTLLWRGKRVSSNHSDRIGEWQSCARECAGWTPTLAWLRECQCNAIRYAMHFGIIIIWYICECEWVKCMVRFAKIDEWWIENVWKWSVRKRMWTKNVNLCYMMVYGWFMRILLRSQHISLLLWCVWEFSCIQFIELKPIKMLWILRAESTINRNWDTRSMSDKTIKSQKKKH